MGITFGVLNRNNSDMHTIKNYVNNLAFSAYDKKWLITDSILLSPGSKVSTLRSEIFGKISFSKKDMPDAPAFDCGHNLMVIFEGNLYNIRSLQSDLEADHTLITGNASEVVAHLLEDEYKGDLKKATKQIISRLDGAYLLVANDGKQTVFLRDPNGLRPAFYAESEKLIAFASLKKILWHMGLENVKPLRAGMLASVNKHDITFDVARPIVKADDEFKICDMRSAVDEYCKLVRNTVRKQVNNLGKLGVLMSGGVDSCLMAKLVTEMGAEGATQVTAYTAGTNGTDDIEYAKQFARELGIKHRVRKINVNEIESYIPKVASTVEERDMVQIEAGIGIYAALEMASQDGIHEIISGQGPDELWGGYTWYPQIIAAEGYEGLQKRMWDDLQRGDIETFDRENKIAMAHRSEQLFPYCDAQIVTLATNVSPRLKVKSADDNVGKHPHREAAVKLGVPKEFAYRAKNAAQHGTGVHETLDAISRKNGFTPEVTSHSGYIADLVSKEKLASSTRYGYRYSNKELWQVPGHVQFYLDSVAYNMGLLNQNERATINHFLQKASIQ